MHPRAQSRLRLAAMTVEDLEADLAAVRLAEAPDDWALAAYRLAVARSEAATQPEDGAEALALLDKASRILTADRAPVEHARILTAAANCHRAGGRTEQARQLFVRAAELLETRAGPGERAGALINVGLSHCEAGQPRLGIEALDRAIELTATEHRRRKRGPTRSNGRRRGGPAARCRPHQPGPGPAVPGRRRRHRGRHRRLPGCPRRPAGCVASGRHGRPRPGCGHAGTVPAGSWRPAVGRRRGRRLRAVPAGADARSVPLPPCRGPPQPGPGLRACGASPAT